MTKHQDPFADVDGVVGSLEEIREHIGELVPPVVAKVIDRIDQVSRPRDQNCLLDVNTSCILAPGDG